MISLLMVLCAQDLIDRSSTPPEKPPESRVVKEKEITRYIPFPRDVEASSVEPEDFLGPLLKEDGELMQVLLEDPDLMFAKGALTLLCQVSPTLCNVFKHIRSNANAAREAIQDTIRSLEEKVPGFAILTRSEIIRDCIREEIAGGTSPGKALKVCLKRDKLKGALGEWLDEVDFATEVSKWLRLDKAGQEILRKVLRPVRITSKGIELREEHRKLLERFRERAHVWTTWLRDAVSNPRRASRQVIKKILELGFTEKELGRMRAIADWIRERYFSSLSRTIALTEIEKEVTLVDGWLSRLKDSVGLREYLKAPAQQHQTEIRQVLREILQESEASLRIQKAVVALRSDVDRELDRRLSQRIEQLLLQAKANSNARDARPWGSLPK